MKRPIAHTVGQRGENLVAGIFLKHGWIVERFTSDYGYDFLLQQTQNDVVVPAFAMLQVKTLQRCRSSAVKIRLKTSHIIYWTLTPIPVWLAVVDLEAGTAYLVTAVDILEALKRRARQSWKASNSTIITVDRRSRLSSKRLRDLEASLREYWSALRDLWQRAKQLSSVDQTSYVSWSLSNSALQGVIIREAFLRAELGDQRAASLLHRAAIDPLTCHTSESPDPPQLPSG